MQGFLTRRSTRLIAILALAFIVSVGTSAAQDTWVDKGVTGPLCNMNSSSMVYDAARDELVHFGGGCPGPIASNQTWVSRFKYTSVSSTSLISAKHCR